VPPTSCAGVRARAVRWVVAMGSSSGTIKEVTSL
jgi:hypothetical protein